MNENHLQARVEYLSGLTEAYEEFVISLSSIVQAGRGGELKDRWPELVSNLRNKLSRGSNLTADFASGYQNGVDVLDDFGGKEGER